MKRKENNELGYPTRLCNRHFKDPEAQSKRLSIIEKVSLVKD
jgi:hypothetical protein